MEGYKLRLIGKEKEINYLKQKNRILEEESKALGNEIKLIKLKP